MKRLGRAVLIALLAAASCGGDESTVQGAAPVFALDRNVTAEIAPVDPNRAGVLPATDLQLTLQELLTEHVAVIAVAMRAALVEGPDLAAALDAITTNTDALTQAIGLAYGPAGARAFDQLWTNHIEFFVRYARAVGTGDDEGAAAALGQLGDYALDFSSFCDLATGGGAPAAAVAELLHGHVDQLIAQLDAWAAGDAGNSAALVWTAQQHTATIAAALATAISTQQPLAFPPPEDEAAAAKRIELQLAVTAYVDTAATLAAAPATASEQTATLREIADRLTELTGVDAWGTHADAGGSLAGNGTDASLAAAAAIDQALVVDTAVSLVAITTALIELATTADPAAGPPAIVELHDDATTLANGL